MTVQNNAASVSPPVAGSNIYKLAVTTSSVAKAIPDAWKGKYLHITALGGIVYFALGDSTLAVDETAVTTVTTAGAVTFDGGECVDLADGLTMPMDLFNSKQVNTHFAVKGSAACVLQVVVASGPV